ncbi:MAG: glycosyltransferase family 4 protein [Saprospiraceae bacterium]|nr:glycosyltransferase family 4 protein [Saprospiraceae bacterium]
MYNSSLKIYYEAKRAFYNYTGLGNYSRWLVNSYAQIYPDDSVYLLKPKGKNSRFENGYFFDSIQTINYSNTLGLSRSLSLMNHVPKEGVFHGLSAEIPFQFKKCKKVIVTIHDLIFLSRPGDYKFLDRTIMKAKVRYALEHSDAIISISQYTTQEIHKYFKVDPKKITTIYQNCNSIFYNKIAEEQRSKVLLKYGIREPYWICVSSFNGRKNIQSIIEAYALIPDKMRIPIVLIGSGALKKQCVMRTEELKLSQYIKFLDHLESEELPSLYQASIGLIYPSLIEGFGIPALEAMASGIPLIGHKGSSVEEAAGEAGLFIDCLSKEELASAILKLQSDTILRSLLLKNATNQMGQYSNQKLINQLNKIYSE